MTFDHIYEIEGESYISLDEAEDLVQEIKDLREEIEDLKEYKWRYEDLCQ